MSQSQTIVRQPAGRPTGGQFAAHSRDDATIQLTIAGGDNLGGMSAAQSRALVESAIMHIDAYDDERQYAETPFEEAIAGGRYNAFGEIVAYLTSDHEGDVDYVEEGERFLDERRAGRLVELETDTSWPGPWSALQRQLAVDYFRSRADHCFEKSQVTGLRPDVEAHFMAQFEVFSEMSLDLSASAEFPVAA